jgi:hypothetical protein
LFGQRLKLLSLACSRGPAFIAVGLPDGRRRLIRRAATDLEHPAAETGAAVPRISARALLPLARHIRSMLVACSEEARHATPSPPGSPAPPAGGDASPSAPAAMGRAAGTGAGATGATGRWPAPARPRGGTPC